MRFYRVHAYTGIDSSLGFSWHTSAHAAAKELARIKRDHADKGPELSDVQTVEVKPTKAGILSALKKYAAHPDNG